MKVNIPKVTILFILLGIVTIIGLSWYWYGTDPWFLWVVGLFVAGGIAIGLDRYIMWKNRKR